MILNTKYSQHSPHEHPAVSDVAAVIGVIVVGVANNHWWNRDRNRNNVVVWGKRKRKRKWVERNGFATVSVKDVVAPGRNSVAAMIDRRGIRRGRQR
ncbi:hypothetical protein ACLB2K_013909 [Fragaria x ananassa]